MVFVVEVGRVVSVGVGLVVFSSGVWWGRFLRELWFWGALEG